MRRGEIGFTFSGILTILLGLLVIIVLVNWGVRIITDVGYAGFFGKESPGRQIGRITNGSGFTPYETQLSLEEKIVDDSMKALVMAINSVSSGQDVSVVTQTPEDNPFTDTQKKIGWVRVEYWADIDFVSEFFNTDMYVQRTFSGEDMFSNLNPYIYIYDKDVLTSHPQYYEEKRVDGFETMYNFGIHVEYTDGTPACDKQTTNGDKFDGSDLATYDPANPLKCQSSPSVLECPYLKVYYCGKQGHITEEASGRGIPIYYQDGHSTAWARFLLQPTAKDAAGEGSVNRDGFWTGVGDTLDTINPFAGDYYTLPAGGCMGGVTIREGIQVACDKTDYSCMVCGFGMPQQTADSAFITSFGKPQYLVYYEQFPKGPEAHWTFDVTDSLWNIGRDMVVAASIEFIGLKFAPGAGKQISKNLMEGATETVFKELSTTYTKEGTEAFIKLSATQARIASLYGGKIGSAAASELDTALVMAMEDAVRAAQRGTTKVTISEIETAAAQHFESVVPLILKEYGEEGVQKMTAEEVEALSKTIIKEAADGMTKPLSRAVLKEAAVELSYYNLLNRMLDESGEKLSKEAVDEMTKEAFEQATKGLSQLPKSYQTAAMKAYEQRASSLFTKEGIFKRAWVIDETAAEAALSGVPHESMAKLFSEWGAHTVSRMPVPTGGWIDGPVLPIMLKLSPSTLNPLAQGAHAFQWMYGKRWTFLLMAGVVSQKLDDMYSHFTPSGMNTLSVSTPMALGTSRDYPLSPAAEKFYIALHERYNDDDVPTKRFYLVSPCRTDLKVEKAMCKCFTQKENLHFNFGGGFIDVMPTTLAFKNPDISEEDARKVSAMLHSRPSENKLTNSMKSDQLIAQNVDYSMAVKECVDRSTWEGVQHYWSSLVTGSPSDWEEYSTECLLIKPKPYVLAEGEINYCYGRFPASENVQSALSGLQIAYSITVPVLTVIPITAPIGAALLPTLVPVAAADAGIRGAITEFWQKWPNTDVSDPVEQISNANKLNG